MSPVETKYQSLAAEAFSRTPCRPDRQMNQIAGYDIDVQVNPAFVRANEIPYLVGSPACLESLIGKIPSMDIADTLRRMYQS